MKTQHEEIASTSMSKETLDDGKYGSVTKEFEALRAQRIQNETHMEKSEKQVGEALNYEKTAPSSDANSNDISSLGMEEHSPTTNVSQVDVKEALKNDGLEDLWKDMSVAMECSKIIPKGSSGVGFGNFLEIGPLDNNLKPRSSTWLRKADLLFVDNPVGTGYSFVEDTGLFVTSDEEAPIDLTTLLKKLYNKHKSLQKSPLYIVAESYGGKFAATVGLSVVGAVKAGELKLKLGGVVLGDSWISPEDFVLSWGPLLLDVSRLDKNGAENSNSLAEKIRGELKKGLYRDAERTWAKLEDFIISNSNNVDFYNFL